jgi:hypothetical protein
MHLNTVAGMGGAIAADVSATPTIRDCHIHDNTASTGGGVCLSASGGSVTGCRIELNDATFGGGAALMSGLGVEMKGCRIAGNESVHSGAGIYASDSTLELFDCEVADNTTQGSGGALYLLNSGVVAHRTRFVRNRASLSTGGILLDVSSLTATSGEIADNGVGVAFTGSRSLADARHNWWGHASGPYHPTLNPMGQGDTAGDGVQFTPWMVVAGIDDAPPVHPATWGLLKALYR